MAYSRSLPAAPPMISIGSVSLSDGLLVAQPAWPMMRAERSSCIMLDPMFSEYSPGSNVFSSESDETREDFMLSDERDERELCFLLAEWPGVLCRLWKSPH